MGGRPALTLMWSHYDRSHATHRPSCGGVCTDVKEAQETSTSGGRSRRSPHQARDLGVSAIPCCGQGGAPLEVGDACVGPGLHEEAYDLDVAC